MKKNVFIRFMHRLCGLLFYGQGALLLTGVVLLPLGLLYQSNTVEPLATARKNRVRYDTTFSKSVSGGSSYNLAMADNRGNFISKIDWQEQYLTYYDETGNATSRLRIDSLEHLYRVANQPSLPDSVRQRVLADQRHQTRQIDSVLQANPTAMIHRMPDRWLLQPDVYTGTGPGGTSFAYSIQVPIRMYPMSPKHGFINTTEWHQLISYEPYSDLRINRDSRDDYRLNIFIRRWADLTRSVWPLFALSLAQALVYVLVFWFVTLWFWQIFADLAGGNYFHEQVANRLSRIGWLFACAFVLKNLLDTIQPLVASAYIRQQGYNLITRWVLTGFDYWLWLSAGLILIAFAQIFRYGTQLQHEQDLTV